jgi:hypothetical protein
VTDIKYLPYPPRELVELSRDVNLWVQELDALLNNANKIEWNRISFTGSDLADIETRLHNVLQSIQGGTTDEYYHLTEDEHGILTALTIVPTAIDYTVVDGVVLVLVDSSGSAVEVTLPASGADFRQIFVNVQTGGNDVTVTPNGSDTVNGDSSLIIEYANSNAQLAAVTGGWVVV